MAHMHARDWVMPELIPSPRKIFRVTLVWSTCIYAINRWALVMLQKETNNQATF